MSNNNTAAQPLDLDKLTRYDLYAPAEGRASMDESKAGEYVEFDAVVALIAQARAAQPESAAPTVPNGYALVPEAANADEIVSRLYRRFKDWAARGFGPSDVTWCEVKADVLAMIAETSPSATGTTGVCDDLDYLLEYIPDAAARAEAKAKVADLRAQLAAVTENLQVATREAWKRMTAQHRAEEQIAALSAPASAQPDRGAVQGVPDGFVLAPIEPYIGERYAAGEWSRRNWEAALADLAEAPSPASQPVVSSCEATGAPVNWKPMPIQPTKEMMDAARLDTGNEKGPRASQTFDYVSKVVAEKFRATDHTVMADSKDAVQGDERAAAIVDHVYQQVGFKDRDAIIADVQTMLAASSSPASQPVAPEAAHGEWVLVPRRSRSAMDRVLYNEGVRFPTRVWELLLAAAPSAVAQIDHDEAVLLLSTVFDAWENGDPCYEDPDTSSGFLGMAFRLDDDVFNRCCVLLNRLNPPRNVSPSAVAPSDAKGRADETVTRSFAVACLLEKSDGAVRTHSGTLHTVDASSAEQAKGEAVDRALRLKPGFAVWEVLCVEVVAPPPTATSAADAKDAAQWTKTPPTEQADYWNWDGDHDHAPMIYHVLWSGTAKKCFVSAGQYGIDEAIWCDNFDGWWLKIEQPSIPSSEKGSDK